MPEAWLILSRFLLASGIALFLWSLLWDRARGRFRCPKCWYDMAGAAAAKPDPPWFCPECAKTSTRPSHLRRIRVHTIGVRLSLLIVVISYAVGRVPEYLRAGWWGAAPGWFIACFAPVLPDAWATANSASFKFVLSPTSQAMIEAQRRIAAAEFYQWESQILFDRIFKANPASLDQLIAIRGQWPRNEPMYVQSNPSMLGISFDRPHMRFAFVRSGAQAGPAAPDSTIGHGLTEHNLGLPPKGAPFVDVECQLWMRPPESGGTLLWRSIVRRVRLEASAQSILSPADDRQSRRIVGRLQGMTLDVSPDGQWRLYREANAIQLVNPDSPICSHGAVCEFIHRGKIVARARLIGTDHRIQPDTMLGWRGWPTLLDVEWLADGLPEDRLDGTELFMRVKGDANVALRDLDSTHYWSGEITVPLAYGKPTSSWYRIFSTPCRAGHPQPRAHRACHCRRPPWDDCSARQSRPPINAPRRE